MLLKFKPIKRPNYTNAIIIDCNNGDTCLYIRFKSGQYTYFQERNSDGSSTWSAMRETWKEWIDYNNDTDNNGIIAQYSLTVQEIFKILPNKYDGQADEDTIEDMEKYS